MNSPFHIRCDLCFPLLYPLHTSSYPTANGLIRYFRQKATANGLIRYFRQKAWFLPKDKLFPLMLSLPNKKFRLNSTFCKVLFTKSVVFVKRWIYFPLFLFSPHLVLPYGKRTHKVLSAKSVVFTERRLIFPLLYHSDKTAPPDSPFRKVLFTKSVVFVKRCKCTLSVFFERQI